MKLQALIDKDRDLEGQLLVEINGQLYPIVQIKGNGFTSKDTILVVQGQKRPEIIPDTVGYNERKNWSY